MIITRETENAIVVLRLKGATATSAILPTLTRMIEVEVAKGSAAVLIDLSSVDKLRRSGIGALLQLGASLHRDSDLGIGSLRLGICGVTTREFALMRSYGIDKVLPIFPTREDAFASPKFRRRSLAGTRAILLAGRQGAKLAPLTLDRPAMMLDVLGRPVADHVIDRIKGYGIRDVVMTVGHQAPRVIDHFKNRRDVSMFFSREGQYVEGIWRGMALGTAETLARLQAMHGTFDDDVVVVESAGLADIDFFRMMTAHRKSGALLTVATNPDAGAKAGGLEKIRRAKQGIPGNTGVYVISPRLFSGADVPLTGDIGTSLLEALRRQGHPIHVFDAVRNSAVFTCARDYVDLLFAALSGTAGRVSAEGEQVKPGVFVHARARLEDPRAIDGPAYIGAGARVAPDARIIGPCVVGQDCNISANSLLRNSIVWDRSSVLPGAIVDTMVASGTWSVNHRFADGTLRPRTSLDGVTELAKPQDNRFGTKLAQTA